MLKYKKIGSGKISIIVLHELMGDCRNYEPILPYLDKEKFSYYFTDLRGYGLSKKIKGNYNLQEATDDIIELISYLNLNEVILLGHSMSTMICQNLALLDKRVKKLILTTPISASGIKVPLIQKNSLLKKMGENKKAIEQIVRSSSRRHNKTWENFRVDMGYSSSLIEARVGYMNMYLNTTLEENKINENIEVNIIVGKYDSKVFEKDEVEKNFSNYKSVKIVQCEEAGHYPMIECPVFFASKLEAFCLK